MDVVWVMIYIVVWVWGVTLEANLCEDTTLAHLGHLLAGTSLPLPGWPLLRWLLLGHHLAASWLAASWPPLGSPLAGHHLAEQCVAWLDPAGLWYVLPLCTCP